MIEAKTYVIITVRNGFMNWSAVVSLYGEMVRVAGRSRREVLNKMREILPSKATVIEFCNQETHKFRTVPADRLSLARYK